MSIEQEIYNKHLVKLNNLEVPNKRLIICFSGTPGSGKSGIAKNIEKRYKAIRVENDQIRKIIHNLRKKDSSIDQKEALEKYVSWLLRRISESKEIKNKLIILDSSIDRRYPAIDKIAEELGFVIFIISMTVHPKKVIERIKKRNKVRAVDYIKKMEGWIKDKEEFNKNKKADVLVDNNDKPDLNKLYQEINRKLA